MNQKSGHRTTVRESMRVLKDRLIPFALAISAQWIDGDSKDALEGVDRGSKLGEFGSSSSEK